MFIFFKRQHKYKYWDSIRGQKAPESCFFLSGLFSRTFTIHRTSGEGGHFLSPLYHFHSLYRHLDTNRGIILESSSLHIARGPTRTVNPWFPNASPNTVNVLLFVVMSNFFLLYQCFLAIKRRIQNTVKHQRWSFPRI